MTPQERRLRYQARLARESNERAEIARIDASSDPLTATINSLPNCMDTQLRDHFADRVTSIAPQTLPCQIGYTCVIDGRAVTDLEHEEVCRIVVGRLAAIVEWSKQVKIDLVDIVDREMEQIDLQEAQDLQDIPTNRSPNWLLEIVRSQASGASSEVALSDFKACWVLLQIKDTIMRIEKDLRLFAWVAAKIKPPSLVVPPDGFRETEVFVFVELGIRYQRFGGEGVLWRLKTTMGKSNFVKLSTGRTTMFEKLLFNSGHQCGDEELLGTSESARGPARKMRDSLCSDIECVGLTIRDSRLLKK